MENPERKCCGIYIAQLKKYEKERKTLSRIFQINLSKRYCKTHEAKYTKMIGHCDDCKKGIISVYGKEADYFNELNLSPLHTSKEFDYIPSFACLLGNDEDAKIKKFVEKQIAKNSVNIHSYSK